MVREGIFRLTRISSFSCIISFLLFKNPVKWMLPVFPFYRQVNGGPEVVTGSGSHRLWVYTQTASIWLQICVFNCSAHWLWICWIDEKPGTSSFLTIWPSPSAADCECWGRVMAGCADFFLLTRSLDPFLRLISADLSATTLISFFPPLFILLWMYH